MGGVPLGVLGLALVGTDPFGCTGAACPLDEAFPLPLTVILYYNLAIASVGLRNALGRLLFFSGRDRSRKLDRRIGHVHVDIAAREQRLALELFLDGALQRRRIARRGLIARGQTAQSGS